MDELEKNDALLNGEDAEEEKDVSETFGQEDNSVQTEDEKFDRELEDIREMFQNELDKAMSEDEAEADKEAQEGQDGEMLIQELEEIEDEKEEEDDGEIPEEELCECCGEKRRDISFGEDYPYCADCRNLMKANPLNALGMLMVLLMLVVSGFALGNMATNADAYTTLLTADEAYVQKQLVDAATSYQSYLSSVSSGDEVSMKAVKNTIKTMASLGYYSDANTLVETYFSDAQLKMPWNKEYAEIQSEYTMLMNSSELINDEFSDALNGEDFDYDEEIAKADKLIEEKSSDEQYNTAFLEYAKYLIMLIDGQSNEVQLEQLKKIEEVDGGKHPWIYLTYILNTYGKMGDVENAKIYFDKCMEVNVQEAALYNYYANAYRFCDEPDADKILEIAQLAASNYSENAYPVFYRAYAIAYLLKGDGEKALTNMVQYLQSCQSTVSDYNLYALCAIAAEDDESYEDAKTTLEGYGYELSSLVTKCKKGKITVTQALTEKGGDI